jgi:hypothetical protein
MKVTALHRGFFGHLKEPGSEFEIPDKPFRKLRATDDDVTRSIATKKGDVPEAFASSWMQPGFASEQRPAESPRAPLEPSDEDPI